MIFAVFASRTRQSRSTLSSGIFSLIVAHALTAGALTGSANHSNVMTVLTETFRKMMRKAFLATYNAAEHIALVPVFINVPCFAKRVHRQARVLESIFKRSPTAIFWFVITVGVYSINAIIGWTRTHVFEKFGVAMPSCAKLDPSSTIGRIFSKGWIQASHLHMNPTLIGERVTLSMSFFHEHYYIAKGEPIKQFLGAFSKEVVSA